MGITITIQTYNRAEELRKTLRSLAAIDRNGATDHEVIIVDNNSHDHTPAVVESFERAFAGLLRYVREPKQGLSHARNRAVEEAKYDIVAFLDDDVDIDTNWLRALATALEDGEYAALGGRAHLVYPVTKPKWLGERSEGLLTKVDQGSLARPAKADELFGVNLSIRKTWLQRVGGFRTDLGRVGKCLLSSEETDVLERIVRAGGKLLYDPAAVVGHRVPTERLSRRWFLARSYWGKRGEARQVSDQHASGYELLRETWRLGRSPWRVLTAILKHGIHSEETFYQGRLLACRLGYWTGLAGRLWRGKKLTAIGAG